MPRQQEVPFSHQHHVAGLGLDCRYCHTSVEQSSWHIPQTHYLEAWGDARSLDGAVSLMQPLIAPLYGGKAQAEVLGAVVRQQPLRSDYELLREFWQAQRLWPDFENGWRQALHDGFIRDSVAPPKPVQVKGDFLQTLEGAAV